MGLKAHFLPEKPFYFTTANYFDMNTKTTRNGSTMRAEGVFALVSRFHILGYLERIMGVEPTTSAWEANVLPINYIRVKS